MTKIVDFALSKAKTTLALALMVIIAGSYARSTISVASDPNIQIPLVSVSVFLMSILTAAAAMNMPPNKAIQSPAF